MVNDPDRAEILVAEAGHAIAAARYYLSVAVTIGDETRGGIARCENDVAELRTQSAGIRNGEYPRVLAQRSGPRGDDQSWASGHTGTEPSKPCCTTPLSGMVSTHPVVSECLRAIRSITAR